MPQAAPVKNTSALSGIRLRRLLRETLGILTCVAAILLILALASFDSADPGWRHLYATKEGQVENLIGSLGAYVADLLYYSCGFAAWLLPLALLISGARLMLNRDWRWSEAWGRAALLFLFLLIFAVLCSLHVAASPLDEVLAGGIAGKFLAGSLHGILGLTGTTLLLLVLMPIVASLYTEKSLLALVDTTGNYLIRALNITLALCQKFLLILLRALSMFLTGVQRGCGLAMALLSKACARAGQWFAQARARLQRRRNRPAPAPIADFPPSAEKNTSAISIPVTSADSTSNKISPQASVTPSTGASNTARKTQTKSGKRNKADSRQKDLWQEELPPHSLLTQGEGHKQLVDQSFHNKMAEEIARHLSDFGVKAEITGALSGPVVTRYEIQPAAGVKASKITALASDLARSLSVLAVRVVEVIPGKTVVGLEVPNSQRQVVRLAEVIDSKEWKEVGSGLPLALGVDISGVPVVADLSRMPHLLVAGTTGSGKSVSLNTMMISLLYYGSASLIRLIMIDPKMLELSVYEGIPQLLTPVITDMSQASKALSWCVREMDRRYALMAAIGVRNIQGYNHKVKMAEQRNQPLEDPRIDADNPEPQQPRVLEKLPYIVVVIDEYADMMMVAGKKVEMLIMRLSQKARAAGIHLILATQRPSVDVVTGLIKSNIPNRIAFQVSSRIDSRTILDQMGAEQLLGNGDMLMIRPGMKVPVRVHGAFVADDEVHRVVDYLKLHSPGCEYSEDILAESVEGDVSLDAPGLDDSRDEEDPTYQQAVKIVRESGRASISYLQRRLRIGYNRSASLLERMERAGIVSALHSGGSREVIGKKKSESE